MGTGSAIRPGELLLGRHEVSDAPPVRIASRGGLVERRDKRDLVLDLGDPEGPAAVGKSLDQGADSDFDHVSTISGHASHHGRHPVRRIGEPRMRVASSASRRARRAINQGAALAAQVRRAAHSAQLELMRARLARDVIVDELDAFAAAESVSWT